MNTKIRLPMRTSSRQRRSSGRPPRNAVVMVCVLVCVSIATALVTATVYTALRAHRELRVHRQLRQTELLLTAGVQRAASQLSDSADYTGEIWQLSEDTLSGFPPASVKIDIENGPDDHKKQIHVVARLANGVTDGTQRSTTLFVDIPTPSTNPQTEP